METVFDDKPAEARTALRRQFQKIRWRHGSLGPLCGYLRSKGDTPQAKPLLAMALAADEQYEAAAEVLEELAREPKIDPWVTAELARVRQMLEVQKTWHLMDGGRNLTSLAPAEKKRVNEIADLPFVDAREALKELCRELLEDHGDLAPLLDYLRTLDNTPTQQALLAIAATNNGDIELAESILDKRVADAKAGTWALAELGRLKERQGRTDEAIGLFRLALEQTDEPAMLFALEMRTAQLLYNSGQTEEAGSLLRSLANEPDDAAAARRNYCARVAGMHGDLALSTELFEPAAEGKKRLFDLLYLGECLWRLGRTDEARTQFESALKITTLPRDRRYVLDRIVGAARSANSLGKLMDEWLESDTLTAEQLGIMTGILGGELRRLDELFALFERAGLPPKTRKALESPEFQERLAAAASEIGRTDDALRTYQELMVRHPDAPHYRDGYVRLLLLDGKTAEAAEVYREAITRAEAAEDLMGIAASARRTGLDEIALKAARKAASSNKGLVLNAALFSAELWHEQGETDRAVEIIRGIEDDTWDDADMVMAVVQAYERFGYGVDAIRLCRRAADLSDAERILRKLIALLEEHGRSDEAFLLWRRLWNTASEPMTIMQANDRLLELGSREGRLADLAVELEDRLVEDKLSERELTLLLDIYTSVGDPVSAADVLMIAVGTQKESAVETHKRLLRVYMECELFGRCAALLRELVESDAENRDDHLQMMAVVALERRNNGDAMEVLELLAARSSDGILRDSFSASVLDMLGKHVDAARAYRRTLARNPDEVETWLLWAKALAAHDAEERARLARKGERVPSPQAQDGHKQARELFTAMMEDSEADDLFVLCVDGLLNARAPRHTMLNALRRLNERIAANPHKLLLYRLAADLYEEVGQPEEAARMLDMALPIAADGRSIIMRELIAMAGSADREQEVIRYGRSLLNISEHLPPDECLSLGTKLLEKGHLAEAENAFQRVITDAHAVGAARDVASRYENFGLFEKAGRVIRSLLVENPFDTELLLRLGLIEEKRGDFNAAGEAYQRALELMISRLPRRTGSLKELADQRDRNVGEIERFSELAIRGLIASTRSPDQREKALAFVRDELQAELAELEASSGFALTEAENPRLKMLANLMRRVAFVFHNNADADAIDSELLGRYPGDEQLHSDIATMRKQWQAETDAGQFLTKHGRVSETYRVVAPFLDGKEAVTDILNDDSLTAAQRSTTAVLAAMFGHDDLVGKALTGCDLNQIPEADGELLVAAGLAAGRPELMRDALFSNLNRLRRELEPLEGLDRSRAYQSPAKIFRQIVAAWPALSKQDRFTATSLYGKLFEDGDSRGALTASHDFLLSLTGRADEIEIDRLQYYLDWQWRYLPAQLATIFDRWLSDQPAGERTRAVRRLLESRDDEFRSKALPALASFLRPATVTDELRTEFPELASRPPLYRSNRVSVDMTQERERFAKEIATGLAQMQNDVRKMFVLHDLTLRPAANMLPSDELDLLIEKYRDSRDPFEMLTAFLLLRHAGWEMEALALLPDIASLPAGKERADAVLAALPGLLASYQWTLPAVRLMRKIDSTPTDDLRLNFTLHDPLAILAQRGGDMLDAGSRRIHAAHLLASPLQLRQAARLYYADTRHPDVAAQRHSEFKAARWPECLEKAAGGLPSTEPRPLRSALADVATLEEGQVELLHWMSALTPNWYSREGEMCAEIALVANRRGLSPLVRHRLGEAVEQSALNVFDIKLIEHLGRECPEVLPAALAHQMKTLALHRWRGNAGVDVRNTQARKAMGVHEHQSDRMAALASACRSLDERELATPLARWGVVLDVIEKGVSIHLPGYLRGLPESSRRQALTEFLPFLGLRDARVVSGEGLDVLVNTLVQEGLTEEAEAMVDRYLAERRLHGGRPRWGDQYDALVGGLEDDLSQIDDAVAVILARLGRAADYDDLLWRKNLASRIQRSHLNLSMSISPIPLVNDTGALPEPNQVDDVGRFLDIQLALGECLRAEGVLSAESQVAQICLLGRWCVERELTERAVALRERAEKLGVRMLTGRLWLADLHRLLGEDSDAENIELELLAKDLLPLPRVPTAIDALACRHGEGTADAAAFRLASFTNHPAVIKRAFRHARNEQLKEEYLDLAERLRNVSTRFLPSDAPCPFEGAASVAEWSAMVNATAALFPTTPSPRPLTELRDDDEPAIGRVLLRGNAPRMIYVPIIHDGAFTHLSSGNVENIKAVMRQCEKIADRLYYRYGVRNALLEGTSRSFVERYNRIPLQRRNIQEEGNQSSMITHRTWSKLLEKKAWVLLPTSEKPIAGPLNVLGHQCDSLIVRALDEAKDEGWLRNREVYERHKPRLTARLKEIADAYNEKRRALLDEDPELKREYELIVTRRNDAFLDQVLAPDDPGVVFFGAGHWQELERQLDERDVDYAVVVPKGVRWPPKKMDDAAIYADMLGLGASLDECLISLGDGGSDRITVPIE